MPDTNPANLTTIKSQPKPRPVLVWHPGRDEQLVQPDVAEAARHLGVTVEKVVAAIEGGDLIEGWFVDWAAPSQVEKVSPTP